MSLSVMGQGGNNGDESGVDEMGYFRAVGLFDITHETIVDTILQWTLCWEDNISIGTGEPDGITT